MDDATSAGLCVDGDNSIARRNRISDIGSNLNYSDTTGILVQGDNTMEADNAITGVIGAAFGGTSATGFLFNGHAGLIRGNYITSILPGGGTASGMQSRDGSATIIEQNVVINPSAAAGTGIDVIASPVCLNNRVRNFTTSANSSCINGGGNFSN